ncbi:hypothetical protein GCM10028785_31100 [Hydrogenophaga soli]
MMSAPVASTADTASARTITVRFLTPADLPALQALEQRQWTAQQAASAQAMLQRMQAHPLLCVGAFCATTGEALASLFMKPMSREAIERARDWADCARIDPVADAPAPSGGSLFGISLTSVDGEAAWALIRFFWPHALQQGWRDIYLGSPMPGYRRAREQHPRLSAEHHARARRRGLPADPQLRYYHRKGFKDIVAVRAGYFPHEASLDHAAVLRGRIPLSRWSPVWRRLPLPVLQRLSGWVTALL